MGVAAFGIGLRDAGIFIVWDEQRLQGREKGIKVEETTRATVGK